MNKLFLVVFREEVMKTFTSYARAYDYVGVFGNVDYTIHEVNYE